MRDALTLARDLGQAELTATFLHTRGNLFMAHQQPQEALEVYRQSAALAQQEGMRARALAHAARAATYTAQSHTARTLLDDALTHLRQAEASHETAYDLLFIGRVYHRLAVTDPTLVLRAATVFQEAATLAQTLQDPRALSYAWGYLGRLYEEERRYPEALDLTRRAVLAAQQVHVPEALARGSGKPDACSGRSATRWLPWRPMSARWPPSSPSAPRCFVGWGMRLWISGRPGVHCISSWRISSCCRAERCVPSVCMVSAPGSEHDRAVQDGRASGDYFGDECVAAVQLRSTALGAGSSRHVDRVSDPAAGSDGRAGEPAHRDQRVEVPVTGPDLEQRVRIFRNALHDRDPLRYLHHVQTLYTWLIRPSRRRWPRGVSRRSSLCLTGALRLLPLAALHDGQQFVEKYALAMTLSLTLTDPRPLPLGKFQVLVAGVSGAVAGSRPFPGGRGTLRIQQLSGGTVLREQDFSPERLDTVLRQRAFGHRASRRMGSLPAEAAESFLLTHQGKLTMQRLAQIVGRLRFDRPLEFADAQCV